MARFPFRPGAGPKAIRNPVYWARLALQESEVRRGNRRHSTRSQGPSSNEAEAWNTRWLNLNAVRKAAIAELLVPISSDPSLTERERVALVKRLDRTDEIWSAIDSDIEGATKTHLRSFASAIRALIDYSLKIAIRREIICQEGMVIKSGVYGDATEEFRITFSDGTDESRYFLGQPAYDNATIKLVRKLDRLTAELVRGTIGNRGLWEMVREGPMEVKLNYKHFAGKPEKLEAFIELFGLACIENDQTIDPELQKKVLAEAKGLKRGQNLRVGFPGGRSIEFYRK